MVKAEVFSIGTRSTDEYLTDSLNNVLVDVQQRGGRVVRVETSATNGMYLFTVLYDDAGELVEKS